MNVAYCIDCMEAMAKMPDKCFDLAVVDPPYGGGGHEFTGDTRFGGWFDRYKSQTQINHAWGGCLSDTISVKRTGGRWAEKFGKKS